VETKLKIDKALKGFGVGNLLDNALTLLDALNYSSDKRIEFSPNTPSNFVEQFDMHGIFNKSKALSDDWKSIDFIFQLTGDELGNQGGMFKVDSYNAQEYHSYLFFALELRNNGYTRTQLSLITREINKLFLMPVMILFKHGNTLTFSIINRRPHKKDTNKDVLEKVTLIKDINFEKPHRAHIEILFDLSYGELCAKYEIKNFLDLHNAWQKTLDISELNKKFYRELSNWYFWAIENVEFPAETKESREIQNATNTIRLLTRLIFVWFLKEKGLVPDELFNHEELKKMLNYSDKNKSTYYKAILQNLFFATLNTEMNKDKLGSRKFRGKSKGDSQDQHFMIHNVLRYEDYFVNPQDTFKKYFDGIPFLNGGLFECLDKIVEDKGKEKVIRIDGFSDHPKNVLAVPDYLFFSSERIVDLNEIYGTKNKTYKVRGLIDILDSYKFTVDENTPIEEEIALDPELLGKVFENLLASYNPETGTTARKQTGSFYTPREIVNYMVDESLIAYFMNVVQGDDSKKRLRNLIAYTDEPHQFSSKEVDVLINAIDKAKILDPACGSGAFPMGVLHKLVYILSKLDSDNSKWKDLQRRKALLETEETEKIGNKDERIKRLWDIEDVFENNTTDYGRKLYLIENCIFGVDIQPIAVQIAKLRFFISLIVDQKVSGDKENLGVRPLPNLETKFVAANTLMGIEKPVQGFLRNPEIEKKEEELRRVREKHFTARTPATKEKYRREDEKLRVEISDLLTKDGFPQDTTEKLAKWNPYNQNASADFFNAEQMFGITAGFDVVIGNPPYFNISTISKDFYLYLAEHYKSIHTGYNDIVYYFIYLGIEFLNRNGCCTFITSNYYLGNEYAKKLRIYLKNHVSKIINFRDYMVFDAASIHTCISLSYKEVKSPDVIFFEAATNEKITSSNIEAQLLPFVINRNDLTDDWLIADKSASSIIGKLNKDSILLGDISTIEKGSTSGKNNVFTIPCEFAREKKFESELLRKNVKNGDIERYTIRNRGNYLIYVDNHTDIKNSPKIYSYLESYKDALKDRNEVANGLYPWYRLERPRDKAVFDAREKIVVPYRAENNRFAYDNAQYFNDGGDIRAIVINDGKLNIKYVLALLNSKLIDWFYGFIGKPKGKVREYFNKPLALIPIKKIPLADQQHFITIVDQILSTKKKDANTDTSSLERQIDEMVYKLYDFTPEDIAIVEGKDNSKNGTFSISDNNSEEQSSTPSQKDQLASSCKTYDSNSKTRRTTILNTSSKPSHLSYDHKVWLKLSNWVKEKAQIYTGWADFALGIVNKIKSGKQLTASDKEKMGKCWKQAIKKGFKA
jgi:adenine-specific DNA-methyltransferase